MTHEKLIEGFENQSKIEELKAERETLNDIINSKDPIDKAYKMRQYELGVPYTDKSCWVCVFEDMLKECGNKYIEQINADIDRLEKEFEKI